jgi:hypothetical protein
MIIAVTRRPALAAGHTSIVKFQRSMKIIKLFLSFSLSVCSVDLTDEGKLGYGFTSADKLEEVDIGPGDKPRPTFISKKLSRVYERR